MIGSALQSPCMYSQDSSCNLPFHGKGKLVIGRTFYRLVSFPHPEFCLLCSIHVSICLYKFSISYLLGHRLGWENFLITSFYSAESFGNRRNLKGKLQWLSHGTKLHTVLRKSLAPWSRSVVGCYFLDYLVNCVNKCKSFWTSIAIYFALLFVVIKL